MAWGLQSPTRCPHLASWTGLIPTPVAKGASLAMLKVKYGCILNPTRNYEVSGEVDTHGSADSEL